MFKRIPWHRERPAPPDAAPPQPDLWSEAVAPAAGVPSTAAVTVAVLAPPVGPVATLSEPTPQPVPGTAPTGPLCPRCHGAREGEKESAARAAVCVRCMAEFARAVAQERERAYLASWLHSRQEDTERTTERLRALARRQGVDWQAPCPATTDKARMALRLAPYRQTGAVDAAGEESSEESSEADEAEELDA